MKRTLAGILVVLAVVVGLTTTDAKVRKPHTGPIRVLLIGDSITVSYQARVAELLGAGYAVTGGGVGGTGLLDLGICDGARAKALLKQVDADIAVVEYTGNYGAVSYAPGYQGSAAATCLPGETWGSKQWHKRWKASATKMRNKLASKGGRVMFVLVPTTTRAGFAPLISTLDANYRKVARADVVDAWTAFGGSTFDASLHTSDGLHLSPAGVERMAQTIVAKVQG